MQYRVADIPCDEPELPSEYSTSWKLSNGHVSCIEARHTVTNSQQQRERNAFVNKPTYLFEQLDGAVLRKRVRHVARWAKQALGSKRYKLHVPSALAALAKILPRVFQLVERDFEEAVHVRDSRHEVLLHRQTSKAWEMVRLR